MGATDVVSHRRPDREADEGPNSETYGVSYEEAYSKPDTLSNPVPNEVPYSEADTPSQRTRLHSTRRIAGQHQHCHLHHPHTQTNPPRRNPNRRTQSLVLRRILGLGHLPLRRGRAVSQWRCRRLSRSSGVLCEYAVHAHAYAVSDTDAYEAAYE